MKRWWIIPILGFILLIAANVAAFAYLPILAFIRILFISIGLVIGVSLFPFIVLYLAPASRWLGEVLGRILWKMASKGQGATQLVYTKNRRYKLESVDGAETNDHDSWTRLGGVKFQLAYERDESTFGDAATDPPEELEHVEGDGGEIKLGGRGSHGQVISKKQYKTTDEESVWINIPDVLAQLRDVATGTAAKQSDQAATVDFGGDTNDDSQLMRIFGGLVFLVVGLVTGVILI